MSLLRVRLVRVRVRGARDEYGRWIESAFSSFHSCGGRIVLVPSCARPTPGRVRDRPRRRSRRGRRRGRDLPLPSRSRSRSSSSRSRARRLVPEIIHHIVDREVVRRSRAVQTRRRGCVGIVWPVGRAQVRETRLGCVGGERSDRRRRPRGGSGGGQGGGEGRLDGGGRGVRLGACVRITSLSVGSADHHEGGATHGSSDDETASAPATAHSRSGDNSFPQSSPCRSCSTRLVSHSLRERREGTTHQSSSSSVNSRSGEKGPSVSPNRWTAIAVQFGRISSEKMTW